MRILVVSNYYPPNHVGGYEIACKQAVDALRARGHDVAVLTSTHGVARPTVEDGVHRLLSHRPHDWHRRARARRSPRIPFIELRNRVVFRRAARALRPDVVQFWNMAQISLSAVDQAQRMGLPVSFYIHDSWLARVPIVDPWYRLGLRMSGREPSFRNVQFASTYLLETALAAGRDLPDAEVAYWGVDTNVFTFRRDVRPPRRLLYVGQLAEHKGVHVALEAFAGARDQIGNRVPLTLTVAGPCIDERYLASLRKVVDERRLYGEVAFRGALPLGELPGLYAAHDVLIFPSCSENEGLPLTLLEAMASGTVVCGTTAGGARELVQDGRNAVAVPIGDVDACTEGLVRLVGDQALSERLRTEARRMVETQFDIDETLTAIERGLERAAGSREEA